MKNPLVKPLDTDDRELNKLIKFYNETLGFCPNSIKTMFMRPPIAYAFINLNKAVMENKGRVSSKVKRLVGYLTSTVTGCNYCRAHTIRAAERYGSNTNQLNEIWDFRESKNFDKKTLIIHICQKTFTVFGVVGTCLLQVGLKIIYTFH